jgi:hypothetical protein
MNEKSLDQLLHQRGQHGSSLPPDFQQNVWRKIRLRRDSDHSPAATLSLWQLLFRPQLVAAGLAVAMLVGIGIGSLQPDRVASNTRRALNLDVFGAAAPALPSTVLASNL